MSYFFGIVFNPTSVKKCARTLYPPIEPLYSSYRALGFLKLSHTEAGFVAPSLPSSQTGVLRASATSFALRDSFWESIRLPGPRPV